MKRQSVDSSVLAGMGYNAKTATLELEFNTGQVWQYYDFPEDLWEQFKVADSYGKFFNYYIKDQFEEARIK